MQIPNPCMTFSSLIIPSMQHFTSQTCKNNSADNCSFSELFQWKDYSRYFWCLPVYPPSGITVFMKSSAAALQTLSVLPECSPEVTAHLLVGALALHTDQCVTTQGCDFPSMTTTGINYHLPRASRREVRCFVKLKPFVNTELCKPRYLCWEQSED